MSLWLLCLPALGILTTGYVLGYVHGQDRGAQDAYRAVNEWCEGRER